MDLATALKTIQGQYVEPMRSGLLNAASPENSREKVATLGMALGMLCAINALVEEAKELISEGKIEAMELADLTNPET